MAVPFTTPLLAGTRVRQSERYGIELVVPNPSGGRGVYIVEWPGVRAFCNPTVHDTIMFAAIARLARIDPVTIREAALDTALDGYAGREALAAAQAAREGDHASRLLADFLILAGLVEQVEPTGRQMRRLAERTVEFDQRADHVVRRIAPSFGCPAAHLSDGLAALGRAFAPAGSPREHQTARIPRVIARQRQTEADLCHWLADDPENDIGGLARTVAATMKVASSNAEAVLGDIHTALADPMALLRRWVARADDPLDLAARCDWLLDGWERVCLLWKTAGSLALRRAALLEMAQLLPVLPREINNWIAGPIPLDGTVEACRVVSGNDAWRSGGAAFALIHRNEMLRAMSW